MTFMGLVVEESLRVAPSNVILRFHTLFPFLSNFVLNRLFLCLIYAGSDEPYHCHSRKVHVMKFVNPLQSTVLNYLLLLLVIVFGVSLQYMQLVKRVSAMMLMMMTSCNKLWGFPDSETTFLSGQKRPSGKSYSKNLKSWRNCP